MKLAATISALLFVFYYTVIFGDSMSLNVTSSPDIAATQPDTTPAALVDIKVFVNDSRCNYTHVHVDGEQHANHTTRLACANDTSKYIECLSLWHGYVKQCKPGWLFNASNMSCVKLAAAWADSNATKPANATSMRWIGEPVLNKRSSENISNVSLENSTTASTTVAAIVTTATEAATTAATIEAPTTTITDTMFTTTTTTTKAAAATIAIPDIEEVTTVKVENSTAYPILTDRKLPLVAAAIVAFKPIDASLDKATTEAATTKEAVNTTLTATKPIVVLGVPATQEVVSGVNVENSNNINATSWFNATDLATMV